MISDIRHAIRTLAKARGFTLVAILTLSLGIGATTAVFSIVNSVMLRPLEYAAPDRLVAVRVVQPALGAAYPTTPVNARFYTEWKACPAFEYLALLDCYPGETTLTGAGEPERLHSARVSANFFETLEVTAALGRTFEAGDDAEGAERVAVISDRLWRERFEADPAILRRVITLDHEPHVVIGVLPETFRVPSPSLFSFGRRASSTSDVFTPKFLSEREREFVSGQFNYECIGRLAPGATLADAEAQMNVVAARLAGLDGGGVEFRGLVAPLHDAVVGHAGRGLALLLGSIGAVLLIACLNLAILALVRAERRSHESAVRAALGATRGQLLRQSLAESLLLALAGGVVGIMCAYLGLETLIRLAPTELPRIDEVRIDGSVLGFSILLTTFTGLLFGLMPAWRMARCQPGEALRGESRTTTGSGAVMRVRQSLIALEVGIGALLLVVSALLLSSFSRVMRADAGFSAPTVLTADIAIPMAKYREPAQRIAFHDRLLERVKSMPGVQQAAVSTALPLQGEIWVDNVWTTDHPLPPAQQPNANVRFVTDDFFAAMGIPLLAGRAFEPGDRDRHVAVVSQRLATILWPDENPIGRRLVHHGRQDIEVVGIAGDVRARADQPPVSMIYRTINVWPPSRAMLVVRATGAPRSIAGSIQKAIHEVDTEVPVPALRTIDELRGEAVSERRFQTLLVGAFALSALTLAVIGVYGIVSYTVARRARELGIRAAFGARPEDLSRLVLRQGMKPVAVGLCAGLAAALVAARLYASLLYETNASDPAIFATVAAGLTIVAVIAAWRPARRAARADPSEVLRTE